MNEEKAADVKEQYAPPVDKLLRLGEPRRTRTWHDYSAMGLGSEHIPDLIRMATDEELNNAMSDTLEVWAPLHAWRALGQLRAEAAVEPLLGLFRRIEENDDDWVGDDLPDALGMIGPGALPALSACLADKTHSVSIRTAAAQSISQVGQRHPESRGDCVAALTRQLKKYEENDPTLNGLIISYMLDLEAVEAAPVMEKAFAADCVDESIVGDLEEVQIELGLRETRETPYPGLFADIRQKVEMLQQFRQTAAPPSGTSVDLRAINKAQKQARSKAKKAKKAQLLKRQRRR